MRFLMWGLIGLVIVLWLLHDKKMKMGLSGASKAEVKAKETENMVRCAQCGIHFPASEAIAGQSGKSFCSDDHRRRHAG